MFKSVNVEGNIYMYADDTLIVSRSNNITDVSKTCAESLNKVLTWCKANKLTMNCKKNIYIW